MVRPSIQLLVHTGTNAASFECPYCRAIHRVDTSKFQQERSPQRMRFSCPSCRKELKAYIERRHYFRKKVDFDGYFKFEQARIRIRVKNISRGGLLLELQDQFTATRKSRLRITFQLDDEGASVVSRDVIVRRQERQYIGVEFVSHDHTDRLGTYFLNNMPDEHQL